MRIDVTHDHPYLRVSKKETESTIKSVLQRERKKIHSVSVVYTNNARIRAINEKHLNHKFVTDVITFEMEQNPRLETEIYINLDKARSQARFYGETFRDETTRLLIHGLLHVLGFDDTSTKDTAVMRQEQEAVLQSIRRRKN